MTLQFPWQQIEMVFLDMDGVLLDLHFDNWFWKEFVPRRYSQVHNTSLAKARETLLTAYKNVENTLHWYDLTYWSDQLKLDIYAMKREEEKRIALLPGATNFLNCMQQRKIPVFLVTNAHPQTLAVKLQQYDLTPWLEETISSAMIGLPKEEPQFWDKLTVHLPYRKESTFFADDTEKVLFAARQKGPHHLLHIAQPDSTAAATFSRNFPSTNHLFDVIK